MELLCKLRRDCTVFCLELKQEVFIISENHVILGHSACDVCMSVVVWFRDAARRVQVTDNFIPSSGTVVPEHVCRETHIT